MRAIRVMISAYLVVLMLLPAPVLSSKNDTSFNVIYAGQYGNGYRYNIQGWVYLHIEGDPYERGFQHGYLLSSEITDSINRWSRMIHNHPVLKPITSRFNQVLYDKVSELWWGYCVSQCTRIYYDKYPLEYKEEIRGISDGVKQRGGRVFSRNITCYDILTLNEMYEFLSRLTVSQRGLHPFKTLVNSLVGEHRTSALNKGIDSTMFFMVEDSDTPHHCNGFIATGNATTHGQIVISNSMWSSSTGGGLWWWTYYITVRWNIILDILPSNGYRIIMASAPGFIWSNHDFYQNNAGVVLLETTLPQGPWSTRGLPLAVRARMSIQYSDSIDDVVYYLRYRNDGGMNAVWLIGDTKTGEIARFELGLRHSALYRTFNGFYWSCNNPLDTMVRLENLNIRIITKRILSYIIYKHRGFEYYLPRYHPSDRDLLFEELGKKYYGKIDVDIVKRIMSTDPIVKYSPDCKITDSELVSHNGLWVFMGNPNGSIIDVYNLQHPDAVIEKIPPIGWLRLYGLPRKDGFKLIQRSINHEDTRQPRVLWMRNTTIRTNDFYSYGLLDDNVLYYTTSNGEILALNTTDGSTQWEVQVNKHPYYLTKPVIYNDQLYVGCLDSLLCINRTGDIVWFKPLGNISCNPVISDHVLVIGTKEGGLYGFNVSSGVGLWSKHLPSAVTVSNPYNGLIYAVSGDQYFAVDTKTGNILYNHTCTGVITSPPVIHDGVVLFGSHDTFIYALNTSTGRVLWRYETGWGIDNSPVVYNDTVYVASQDHNLYALDLDNGSLKWFYTCKAAFHSSPFISNGYLVLGCDDGSVYMLDASNGSLIYCFTPGYMIRDEVNYLTTPIRSNPLVGNGVVYVGAAGVIYALQL